MIGVYQVDGFECISHGMRVVARSLKRCAADWRKKSWRESMLDRSEYNEDGREQVEESRH